MSYNIDRWLTLKLEGLVVPLAELNGGSDVTFAPDTQEIKIVPCELGVITGRLKGDMLEITSIEISGEGSGWYVRKLNDALSRSVGTLDAVLIWEGGDEITEFTINDGEIKEERLDILGLIVENRELKAKVTDDH